MTPALSWLLVLVVVGGFALVGWRILNWIDDVRFLRRHDRWNRERFDDEPTSIRELTNPPYKRDADGA